MSHEIGREFNWTTNKEEINRDGHYPVSRSVLVMCVRRPFFFYVQEMNKEMNTLIQHL